MTTEPISLLGTGHDRTVVVVRVLMERLVDELEQVDLTLWGHGDLDRKELREQVGRSVRLAQIALEELPEV